MKTAIAAPADDGRERELRRLRTMLWISLQANAERERILLDVAVSNVAALERQFRASAGSLQRAEPRMARWLYRVSARIRVFHRFLVQHRGAR